MGWHRKEPGDSVPIQFCPSTPKSKHASAKGLDSPQKQYKKVIPPHSAYKPLTKLKVSVEPWFPWMLHIPSKLREALHWEKSYSFPLPEGPIILALYAGKQDSTALEVAIQSVAPCVSYHVVSLDILRCPSHNMLLDEPYHTLATAASEGRLLAVIGGPNCRTWSIRLHIPKPGGGIPLRGRHEPEVWGLPGLSTTDSKKCDGDSVLLVRQMFLLSIARSQNTGSVGLLEHPADPALHSSVRNAQECSSIWHTAAIKQWLIDTAQSTYTFDQCRFGQIVPKTTTIATSLPLAHWTNLFCNHPTAYHNSLVMDSGELSRWPWSMNLQIAEAVRSSLSGALAKFHPSTPLPKLVLPEEPEGTSIPDATGSVGLDRPLVTPTWQLQIDSKEEIIRCGFRQRPIRDGGGKPSYGRMAPNMRPISALALKGDEIRKLVEGQRERFEHSLATQSKDHPFEEHVLSEIRSVLGDDMTIADGQPFHLRLLHQLLTEAGDVDADFPLQLETGLPLGVEEVLPRTMVWPSKDELRGRAWEEDDLEPPGSHDNYSSAKDNFGTLEETYLEEVKQDMVLGPMSRLGAAALCKCTVEELCFGALGAVEEADKIRTIHDASINNVNDHIRQHSLERTTAPTLMDGMHAIHWVIHHDPADRGGGASGPKPPLMLLKVDVKSAHRRCKILQKDWKYQVAETPMGVWINKVGTYGVASAQLHWGRVAAILVRLMYYLFKDLPWGLVFVDDFLFILRPDKDYGLAMAITATFLAVGCPLSWKKTAMNYVQTWIGFQLSTQGPQAVMTPQKQTVLVECLTKLMQGALHTHQEIEKLLGRLQWATMAFPYTKPFLQPMWAWKQAVKTAGYPSKLVRMLANLLLLLMSRTMDYPSPFLKLSKWHGASDAGADDYVATIGGWFTDKHQPRQDQVYWFSLVLEPEIFPWLFDKPKLSQRISAMELLGTLVLYCQILSKLQKKERLLFHIPLMTDNQGNAYSILNAQTKTWPNSALLMELVAQTLVAGTGLVVEHKKRDHNQWADQLTHSDFCGFDPSKRINLTGREANWIALPELLRRHSDTSV